MPRPRMVQRLLWIVAPLLIALTGCAPEAERDPIENVLLVAIDGLAANHSSGYGYHRNTTPNLDLAALDGARFENAYSQQPWTLTSFISLFTGLYPQVHGASGLVPALPGAITLAEVLKRNGFATAAFTGAGGPIGPQFGMGRGFNEYEIGRNDAGRDNEARLLWLEKQAEARSKDPAHRFFLFAHYNDLHSDQGTMVPYDSPPGYRLMFLPGGLNWARYGDSGMLLRLQNDGNVTEEVQEDLRALYDGSVRYCDEVGLGPLLNKLRALDLYDRTLIVITSDHGEEFFEHGAPLHQQTYNETSRVPLVFLGPGIPGGVHIAHVVELVDVMPTILSLLSIPVPNHVQGQDLNPLFTGDEPRKKAAYVDGRIKDWTEPVVKSHLVMEHEGQRWSYMSKVDKRPDRGGPIFETIGSEELYLLDTDPNQKANLVAEYPEIAGQLRAKLLRWYSENESRARELQMSKGEKKFLSEEQKKELQETLRELHYVR